MEKERVLIVGADAPTREKIVRFFEGKPMRLHFAETVKAARWLLEAVPFSLVMVDDSVSEFLAHIEHRQRDARRVLLAHPGALVPAAQSVVFKPVTSGQLDEMLLAYMENIAMSSTLEQNWDTGDTRKIRRG